MLSKSPTEISDQGKEQGKGKEIVGLWPTTVSCEMNIGAWETALKKHNLIGEFKDIIEGFRNGFDQGIPVHSIKDQKFFTPDNHHMAIQALKEIKGNLKTELDAQRIFGPFSHEQVATIFPFFWSNPLGEVNNGKGFFRPTNHLSFPYNNSAIPSVNFFVDANDFETTWDVFNVVSSFICALSYPVFLALFDWAKAYRQIPTGPSQWPYLMIKDFEGRLLLDSRIKFGGVASCGSFGMPADAWTKIMAAKFDLLKVFRWFNNNLFVKTLNSVAHMDKIVKRSNKLD